MTPERKAEVNRQLSLWEDAQDILAGKIEMHPYVEINDYTADLNALARLEGKLPFQILWDMTHSHYEDGSAIFEVRLILADGQHSQAFNTQQDTEAEARAEAICQYLESKP